MKKALITGCGGMLGSSVYPYLKSKDYDVLATDIDLNEGWLTYLDVRKLEEIRRIAREFGLDIIFHLAALTNLEECEKNREQANRTNHIGTKNIARVCKERDIPLVHISTAGVFDGEKDNYTEEDTPGPVNYYGQTKLDAELAVKNLLEKYFIVRAGWMIGGGRKDHKFVSYLLHQIKQGQKELRVVDDKFGTPTYTKDFARNLEELSRTENYGTYHMVCNGDGGRLDVAKCILTVLGREDIKIIPVSSDYFKARFPAQRASSERLVNSKLKALDLDRMRDWRTCLREYVLGEYNEIGNYWKDKDNVK